MFELSTLNHWHWLSLAAILASLEIIVGTNFFLIWIAICAASVALIAAIFPHMGWQYQFIIFAIEAIACIVFWKRIMNAKPVTDKPNLNQRTAQYIGKNYTLEDPIVNNRGKIKLDGSTWIIEGEDLPSGSKIEIIGANGIVLLVKPAKY